MPQYCNLLKGSYIIGNSRISFRAAPPSLVIVAYDFQEGVSFLSYLDVALKQGVYEPLFHLRDDGNLGDVVLKVLGIKPSDALGGQGVEDAVEAYLAELELATLPPGKKDIRYATEKTIVHCNMGLGALSVRKIRRSWAMAEPNADESYDPPDPPTVARHLSGDDSSRGNAFKHPPVPAGA